MTHAEVFCKVIKLLDMSNEFMPDCPFKYEIQGRGQVLSIHGHYADIHLLKLYVEHVLHLTSDSHDAESLWIF